VVIAVTQIFPLMWLSGTDGSTAAFGAAGTHANWLDLLCPITIALRRAQVGSWRLHTGIAPALLLATTATHICCSYSRFNNRKRARFQQQRNTSSSPTPGV
jgi:hypothetical protein